MPNEQERGHAIDVRSSDARNGSRVFSVDTADVRGALGLLREVARKQTRRADAAAQ